MPSFLKLFTNNQDTLSLGLRYSNIVLLFSIIIHVEITFEILSGDGDDGCQHAQYAVWLHPEYYP